MNEREILARLSAELTRLVKAEIERQDLIDTGLMLDSTEIFSFYNGADVTIEIFSTDYFKYIDGNFSVMDNVTRTTAWQRAMEDAVASLIELQL